MWSYHDDVTSAMIRHSNTIDDKYYFIKLPRPLRWCDHWHWRVTFESQFCNLALWQSTPLALFDVSEKPEIFFISTSLRTPLTVLEGLPARYGIIPDPYLSRIPRIGSHSSSPTIQIFGACGLCQKLKPGWFQLSAQARSKKICIRVEGRRTRMPCVETILCPSAAAIVFLGEWLRSYLSRLPGIESETNSDSAKLGATEVYRYTSDVTPFQANDGVAVTRYYSLVVYEVVSSWLLSGTLSAR